MTPERIDLERHIIGMAMFGGFARAAHILKPNNFTPCQPYNHQTIWAAMAQLWPTEPVELISVTQALSKHKVKYIEYILDKCQPRAISGRNIEYFAVVLLEQDMRAKLIQALQGLQITASNQKNLDGLAMLKDCIDLLKDNQADFFESNATIEKYLESYMPEAFKKYRNYSAAIPAKVAQIKRGAQVKNLFENLFRLTQENPDTYRAQILTRIESLTKHVLIDTELPAGIDQIFNITPHPNYEQ